MKPIAVIAIGGNSLARAGESGTFAEQQHNARITCEGVADALAMGYRVVLTHGNGPQVGEALLRAECAQPNLPLLGLDECDAETQGSMGYLLQQTLDDALVARGRPADVVALVTQVVVSPDDPAFSDPTKPIGGFYTREEACEKSRELGWVMAEDAGRGWRRVVASPRPVEVVELRAIRASLAAGSVVIAVGGGGIPVVRRDGFLRGVDAVIDKDHASALLARSLHADVLLFSTGVERVAVRFGQPRQRELRRVTWEQAERYLRAGEFPAGSMGPKVEAALDFLRHGGRRVIVTSPERISAALRGRAGTCILPPAVAAARRQRTAA